MLCSDVCRVPWLLCVCCQSSDAPSYAALSHWRTGSASFPSASLLPMAPLSSSLGTSGSGVSGMSVSRGVGVDAGSGAPLSTHASTQAQAQAQLHASMLDYSRVLAAMPSLYSQAACNPMSWAMPPFPTVRHL